MGEILLRTRIFIQKLHKIDPKEPFLCPKCSKFQEYIGISMEASFYHIIRTKRVQRTGVSDFFDDNSQTDS